MVTIEDGGHLSFSDLCREGDAPGLSPADCAPDPEVEAEVDLLTRHATVAFLRWRFGSDGTPVALDPAVLAAVSAATTNVEGSFAGVD